VAVGTAGMKISGQVTGVVEPPTRNVLPNATSGGSAGGQQQRQRL
jgi:hypothetical protein